MKTGPCPQCPESAGWPSKGRPSRWARTGLLQYSKWRRYSMRAGTVRHYADDGGLAGYGAAICIKPRPDGRRSGPASGTSSARPYNLRNDYRAVPHTQKNKENTQMTDVVLVIRARANSYRGAVNGRTRYRS